MPELTLKNIPAPLYQRLLDAARRHQRSLDKEAVFALECYLPPARAPSARDKTALLERIRSTRDHYPPGITEADVDEWKAAGRP